MIVRKSDDLSSFPAGFTYGKLCEPFILKVNVFGEEFLRSGFPKECIGIQILRLPAGFLEVTTIRKDGKSLIPKFTIPAAPSVIFELEDTGDHEVLLSIHNVKEKIDDTK